METGFLERYSKFFEPLRNQEISLLELGVLMGDSLVMWRDYFERGTIVGLDEKVPCLDEYRIHLVEGRQGDESLLTEVAERFGPFDIIIDDASHIGRLTKISFWHLFDHLKSGGLYAIEDWGTGYWSGWPDGKHKDSMVQFVKELVDEVGAADIERGWFGGSSERRSRFQSLTIMPGLVMVEKC